MIQSVNEYDCIVVGGGNVGSAAACSLAQAGHKVALIDQQQALQWTPQDALNGRVTALNLASIEFLTQLDVWPRVVAMRAYPYHAMRVWEQGGGARIDFNANETSHPHLGVIVENHVLLTALNQVIGEQPLITRYVGSLQTCTAISEQTVLVECDDGSKLTAPLVLGADGQNSVVREIMQSDFILTDYHQRGVVAIIESDQFHQDTAWQCFGTHGPLALLPITPKQCSIVWSVPDSVCQQLEASSDDEFNQQLTNAFEHKLGDLRVVSARQSFPLRGAQAQHYIGRRLALLGDAAHIVHPLAGLGLNLGLADVISLTECIRQSDRPLGSARVLRQYEMARKADNAVMQKVLEGIDHLFRSDDQIMRSLRHIGVNLADSQAALKQFFMQKALGVAL